MSDLHLDSLEIKNFRCFEHLVIPKLGRVNLIVGKNSVGKTALLEALRLYSTKADQTVIRNLLLKRDEFIEDVESRVRDRLGENSDNIVECVRHLFFGRNYRIGESSILIGETKPSKQIHLRLDLYAQAVDVESGTLKGLRRLSPDEYELSENFQVRLTVNYGEAKAFSRSLDNRRTSVKPPQKGDNQVPVKLIPISGLTNAYLASLWDAIALTELEDVTIQALHIIDKGIEKYSFINDPPNRYPVVKHNSANTAIPLRSLGEGLRRSLGIALALVNTKNGIFLIDEFETGLHNSVQTGIWRIIFNIANKLNIQVFATTHSWDCVEAFQEASAENENKNESEESMLIRLQRKRDGTGIEAVSYNERSMDIATRQGIEVR